MKLSTIRVWDNKENQYVNLENKSLGSFLQLAYTSENDDKTATIFQNDRYIVEFETGVNTTINISNKTGYYQEENKKIYQNDIIRVNMRNYIFEDVVVYDQGAFYLKNHGLEEWNLVSVYYDSYDIEVIGNIHENSDLL